MVKVSEIDIGVDLLLFSRWLSSQRIQHRIAEERGTQVLWIEAEHAQTSVKEALDRYLNDDEFKAQLDAYSAQLTFVVKPNLSAMPRPTLAQAPITFACICIAMVVALLTHFGEGGPLLRALMIVDPSGVDVTLVASKISLLMSTLLDFQWWRLVTPDFLHFSAPHLIFNMLLFWFLGGQLETTQGRFRLIGLFLMCSIIPNIAQYLEAGPLFGGMSGVVYGLVGYCWVYSRKVPGVLVFPPALMGISVVWLVIGYTSLTETLMIGKMANSAHLFGLLVGILYAYVVLLSRPNLEE